MKGSVLSHLIIEINDITKIENDCNVLLSGKIYEYFIGRDESAISELGAYFTDRHIVDYILNKLSPCINDDGTISSMIDMFGGSGGFTTGYINYLNEKYKNGEINWETEIRKINHFDMNEDVIKSAGLEIFCLTGILPNKNNLCYKNSFRDNFNDTKYKYPITNPPYGGDKNKKSTAQEKRDKIKEYIKKDLLNVTDEGVRIARQKQLKDIEKQEKEDKKDNNKTKVCLENCSDRIRKYAHDNKLKGNDKEACSLILLMDILEVGGTAIGVLKEGVFFNSSYKDLRRCLIEKYNVREIISVPSDQFENTSTKTSIIIFDNTEEKTREVKFYDLVVERFTEDKFIESNCNILIVENQGDISGVSDKLVSVASREEILSNPKHSLDGKDYNKKVIVCGEGYELVRLGDVCEFKAKSKRKASEGKKEGEYNFYTSSDKVQKCDEADYKDECLIIGDGGVANIQIDKEFSCSDHNHIIKTNHNKYIYYILSGKMELLIEGFTGSVLKNLSKEYLVNLQIPIPKSEQKIQEWVDKISKPYDEKNSKQNRIKELEEYVQNKIKDITDNEECDEVELGSLCEIKSGNHTTKKSDFKEGPYLVIGGGINPICSHNEYNCEENTILCASHGTVGLINMYPIKTFLTMCFGLVVKNNDNKMYIYNYLKFINKEIINLGNGSTLKCMTKIALSKIKIKIPKNKQHIRDLEPAFEEIEKLQGEVREAETLYNNLIKELSDEAMPKTSEIIELTKDNVDTFEEITEVKEEKEPSIKSSVASSVASGTSIKSLKEQCKSLGIKGYSNKKKEELIKLIENHK
jgi:type I restriction enzyme S subunit